MAKTSFFTNLTTNIDWQPSTWSGLKDQSILANQDETGIVPPKNRSYVTDLLTVVSNGTPQAGAVDYVVDSVLSLKASVFSQSVMLAEDVEADDWLYYEVWFDDGSGSPVYMQKISGLTLSSGDLFHWNFDHPIEGRPGQVLHSEMKIAKGSQDATYDFLQVQPGSDDPLERWGSVTARLFEETDSYGGIFTVDSDYLIRYSADYAVNTTSGPVTLTANEAVGYESFMVFDSGGTFHQNSCFVVIGVDTYEMNKKDKQYNFFKDGSGWKWSEIDREVK